MLDIVAASESLRASLSVQTASRLEAGFRPPPARHSPARAPAALMHGVHGRLADPWGSSLANR